MSAGYCKRCEGGGVEFNSEPGVPTRCEDCDGTGAPRITVTRGSIASRSPGNRRPISNYYECEGPDGRRFTNTSIVTLRDVLRRRYGRDIRIIEPWRTTS